MRMTGFLIGGIMGAAAVMILNNRQVSLSGMGNAGRMIDNMVEKARQQMMPADKRSYYGSGAASNGASANLSEVSRIVNEDPELKNQVDDILKESNASNNPLS